MKRRVFTLGASLGLAAPYLARGAEPEVVRIGWLRAPNDLTLGKARGTIEKALISRWAARPPASPGWPPTSRL
jgi:sulfonate transport system substrate-binding protein